MDSLLVDRVSIYRNSDILYTDKVIPFSSSIGQSFNPEVVLEFTIPAGTTASFQVVGLRGLVGITETVAIPSTQMSKITLNSFSSVTSVASVAGNAGTVNIKYKNKSGQPYYMEQTVVSNHPGRISKNRQGILSIRREAVTTQDEHLLFIKYGPNLLKAKDEIVDLQTNDRFMIIDVDDVKSSVSYHHTEVIISLIDPGLK